jgi:hypothetical protein
MLQYAPTARVTQHNSTQRLGNQKLYLSRSNARCKNGRCHALPTGPRVAVPSAPVHHHSQALLPLGSHHVPPDPTVLALEQPGIAALGYALRETFLHVMLPLLALWLFQRWLDHIEKRTREVRDMRQRRTRRA